MGKSDRIFARNCFACNQPMTLKEEGWPLLECQDCDIVENGTVKGRFRYQQDTAFDWGGEEVPLIDHSKIHLPSPDMIGMS